MKDLTPVFCDPSFLRTVGQALGHNPFASVVPATACWPQAVPRAGFRRMVVSPPSCACCWPSARHLGHRACSTRETGIYSLKIPTFARCTSQRKATNGTCSQVALTDRGSFLRGFAARRFDALGHCCYALFRLAGRNLDSPLKKLTTSLLRLSVRKRRFRHIYQSKQPVDLAYFA